MLEWALLKGWHPAACIGNTQCRTQWPTSRLSGPLQQLARWCASPDVLHWTQTMHDSRQVQLVLQASQPTSKKSYLGLCSSLKPAARWCDSQGLLSL